MKINYIQNLNILNASKHQIDLIYNNQLKYQKWNKVTETLQI